MRFEDLQRELQQARDACGRQESLRIAEAQAEAALLKQELRSRDTHIASQAEQMRAEAERTRSIHDHAEQLRRESDDLRSKLKGATDKLDSTNAQVLHSFISSCLYHRLLAAMSL